MATTEHLVGALKRILKTRGITYAHVAKSIGLSEPSVKRQFSRCSFSLKTLEQICQFAEIDFFDLAKFARKPFDAQEFLSEAQEAGLAERPLMLGVFHLLYHDWQPSEILKHYQVALPECTRILARLDRLGLIELLPGNRVRVRAPRPLQIRPDGPIRKIFGEDLFQDFISVPNFKQHGGHFRFEFREMSRASYALIQRKMDRLAAEFNELAELDGTLAAQERISIGFMLGTRPWDIEAVTGLRKRK